MTRRRRAAFVIVLLGVLLTGCSKGFNRGQMDSALRASSPRYTSSGLSVEEIEKLQPQVKLPIRLAVAPPVFADRRWSRSDQLDSWSPGESSEIESWEQRLRSEGVVRWLSFSLRCWSRRASPTIPDASLARAAPLPPAFRRMPSWS